MSKDIFQLEVPLHGRPISALSLSKGSRVHNGQDGKIVELVEEPVEEDGSAILTVRHLPNLRAVTKSGGSDGPDS